MISKVNLGNLVAFSAKRDLEEKNGALSNNYESTEESNLNDIPNSYYSKIFVESVNSPMSYVKHTESNYQGCLLGGAIGDALGWPVEFSGLSTIRKKYGDSGITDLQLKGRKAEITDDTQMTIFTADGLLKSAIADFDENKIPNMSAIYNSYQDWLATQFWVQPSPLKGWIANIPALYERRAPGNTCIGSLEDGHQGSIESPVNESKGCGGVMRVAPVGLMYYKNAELAFEVGARCAALTHGSPSAYLPAGVHAAIIANIVQGKNIEEAVENAIQTLKKYEGNNETLELLEQAKIYAKSDIDSDTAIRNLGAGWDGHEAIAIAVYCVLKEPNDFRKALILSVNHSGDSDSTGAIVGNIMGTYLGADAIPEEWKDNVELNYELIQLAQDLYVKPSEIERADTRYCS